MNNLKVDVCIAGHGPAGLIAARQLALAGLSVCTIDNPSHKVHKFGETLPGSAIRLLTKLGLQSIIKHLQTEQHANGYYSPRVGGNMSFWGSESPIISDALHDPYGFGLRIDRQKFDMLLAQHAHVEGIVKFSANILDLKKDRNIWNIQLECGKSIATKWIVDATGRSAKIIRLLGIQRHRVYHWLRCIEHLNQRKVFHSVKPSFHHIKMDGYMQGKFQNKNGFLAITQSPKPQQHFTTILYTGMK